MDTNGNINRQWLGWILLATVWAQIITRFLQAHSIHTGLSRIETFVLVQVLMLGVFCVLPLVRKRGESLSLHIAVLAMAATCVSAAAIAIGSLVTTTHQAYGTGFIKTHLKGNARVYYATLSETDTPHKVTSTDDPAVDLHRVMVGASRLVLPSHVRAEAVVWNATQAGRISYIANSALLPVIIAIAAVFGFRILQRAIAGDPFTPANARSFTRLGWFLTLALPLQQLFNGVTQKLALSNSYHAIGTMPSSVDWSFSLVSLVPGLVILGIARIWRSGVELRDFDQTAI